MRHDYGKELCGRGIEVKGWKRIYAGSWIEKAAENAGNTADQKKKKKIKKVLAFFGKMLYNIIC